MKDSQPGKIKKRKFKFKNKNKNSTKHKPSIPVTPVITPNPSLQKEGNTLIFPLSKKGTRGIFILQSIKTKILTKIPKENVFKKYKFNLQLALIPLIILSLILLTTSTLNILLHQKIKKEKPFPLQYAIKISPYPLMDKITNPDISAQSAIIIDAGSHTVLYSKNPDLRFSMASTTKIMTALVALDYYQDKSILTIYSPRIEGSNTGLYQGEKFYFKDLLYAMLLPSSNAAAYAIAENYPGGKDAFIRKMNQKARELNITNTHYEDSVGLDE